MMGWLSERASKLLAVVVLAAGTLSLSGCANVSVKRGEIDGLRKLIEQADRNGAKRCAPRELALATAHTNFAEIEVDQADIFRAEDHLIVARANAQAAYDLSPPSKCSERRFVIDPVPPPPPPKPAPPPPPPKPGDKDGDGYTDNVDQCPDKPENYQGFEDADGCPDDDDVDKDGIKDSVDACELLAEDKDGYLDEDGCPELDNDLDGIIDDKDDCKNEPEDPDGYKDNDGCPDLDNDGDKVADLDDMCPMTPGVKDGPKPGCPKKPALVVVTEKEIKITQQIHFAFGKATIRPVSYPVLDAVTDVLKKNKKFRIEVQGHTDNRGSAFLNKRLSQQRADAVRKYLIQHGIEATRLVARGYGMDRPLVPNTTARNRALNRRVQFLRIEK